MQFDETPVKSTADTGFTGVFADILFYLKKSNVISLFL